MEWENYSDQHKDELHPDHAATGETHFKLTIVSDAFEGVRLPQRQKRIRKCLEEELNELHGVVELKIVAKTSKQWEKMKANPFRK